MTKGSFVKLDSSPSPGWLDPNATYAGGCTWGEESSAELLRKRRLTSQIHLVRKLFALRLLPAARVKPHCSSTGFLGQGTVSFQSGSLLPGRVEESDVCLAEPVNPSQE